MARTQAERITALETELSYIRDELRSSNQKLDELLALRNKGAGAFMLASALFGTSLMGVVALVVTWWRG
jgi:hypothetical protein